MAKSVSKTATKSTKKIVLKGQTKTFANNDLTIIFWKYTEKIPQCLGFCIERVDTKTNKKAVLPAWVGFQGQTNTDWKASDTAHLPIQKMSWLDVSAPRGGSFYYIITPMLGTPDTLLKTTDKSLILKTNAVILSPDAGDFKAYFNRGILSTQSVSHSFEKNADGTPKFDGLVDKLKNPNDPLRAKLAGQFLEIVPSLIKRANTEGGSVYAALYELSDPMLIQTILDNKTKVHLILSNTGPDDATDKDARLQLHTAGMDITDRMLADGHIGHNKFMVYVNKNGIPQSVLTGSTNWTYTGLCAQTNNVLIINNPSIAQQYMDYWQRIKADGQVQASNYRAVNNQVHSFDLTPPVKADIWYSPNTQDNNKSTNSPLPSDMAEVFDLMSKAQKAILFLAFQPGTPSIIDKAAEIETANPLLFIRGAATDTKAVSDFNTTLFHHGIKSPNTVVAASNINDQFSFWEKELLKTPGGHAIIHDKVVVIDPFSPNCVVITGSHNLGYRASYNNDENMVIIKGNQALAAAYSVHILDVYDHYRWRYTLQTNKAKAFTGLLPNDTWQDKYFSNQQPSSLDSILWDSNA